ncbi:hypothetical protein QJQ45_012265 [Haematococcus lacustris]|nr:hypothetical protein QJQ45_012265 [Haematococcus lacustris]
METLGSLYTPVDVMPSFTADCAKFAALCLCKDKRDGDWHAMGSRDGSGFTTLFELTVEQPKHGPRGIAADSEGYIWVAKEDTISRFTAMGASTGKSYSVPSPQTVHSKASAPVVHVSALQCLDDRLFFSECTVTFTEYYALGSDIYSLHVYNVKTGACSLLVRHLNGHGGFAVLSNGSTEAGKVLFMNSSNSLCQLDLGSKEVRVLAAAFPYPTARLFSGPGPLAALLVPASRKGPAGSCLYSCSAEGELQLLRSGLIVAHDMLAVNKAGDVLFFQPHPDNKELLSLVCIRSALPPQVPPQTQPDLLQGKRMRL